jgi:hypothetical protein
MVRALTFECCTTCAIFNFETRLKENAQCSSARDCCDTRAAALDDCVPVGVFRGVRHADGVCCVLRIAASVARWGREEVCITQVGRLEFECRCRGLQTVLLTGEFLVLICSFPCQCLSVSLKSVVGSEVRHTRRLFY